MHKLRFLIGDGESREMAYTAKMTSATEVKTPRAVSSSKMDEKNFPLAFSSCRREMTTVWPYTRGKLKSVEIKKV